VELAGKRFAVIGGAGFIGSHVTDQLLQAGAREIVVFDDLRRGRLANLADASRDKRVRFVQGSITDRDKVFTVIAGVDGVFLLAALWLDECDRDPRTAWEVNVLGTWNVVEACRSFGRPRIVFSSSASVYGDAVELPITEDHPFTNRTVYGATKIAGEQMLWSAASSWAQPYAALRYMNVYGPRMDDRGAYVSVIIRVLERLSRGKAPIVYGDGTQTFDFVHVSDVARANILAMTADFHADAVNVGSGRGTSVNDLVARLAQLCGSSAAPIYEPELTQLVKRRVGDTRKATALMAFDSRVSLERGLTDFVNWWRTDGSRASGRE